MFLRFLTITLSLGLTGVAAAATSLANGESKEICKEVVVNAGSGISTTMTARLMEADYGPNDDMGDASIADLGNGKYKVSAEITNCGGDLKGPDGSTQNGGPEGDCIEVYLEITVQVFSTGGGSVGAGGGSISLEGPVSGQYTVESSVHRICAE